MGLLSIIFPISIVYCSYSYWWCLCVCLSVCLLGELLKEKHIKLFRLWVTMGHFGQSDLDLIILVLQDLQLRIDTVGLMKHVQHQPLRKSWTIFLIALLTNGIRSSCTRLLEHWKWSHSWLLPTKVNGLHCLAIKSQFVVTSCTHVHQLFRQISNLSDMILLICSFIVVPRELLFLFVQWRGHDCTLAPLSFLPHVERVRGGTF